LTSEEETEKLKDEIVSSMAQVEDKHHRVVLSLMIRIMGTQERFIHEIFQKLDTLIQDEERIREIVLNGHMENHSKHHEWLQRKIEIEEENKKDFRGFLKTSFGRIIIAIFLFILGFHADKVFPRLFGGF
jgi:tRNA G18 (ribose-2'-O)-methylase SpoU